MPNGSITNSPAPGKSSKGFYKIDMRTPDIFSGDMEICFTEIMYFTESNYRTKADVKNLAVAGLSMGSFHSLYISANQPKMFDYIGFFSPAILPPAEKEKPVYQNLDSKLKTQQTSSYKLYWIAL